MIFLFGGKYVIKVSSRAGSFSLVKKRERKILYFKGLDEIRLLFDYCFRNIIQELREVGSVMQSWSVCCKILKLDKL